MRIQQGFQVDLQILDTWYLIIQEDVAGYFCFLQVETTVEQDIEELVCGIRHREGAGAEAVFGLNHLVTTVLNSVDQRVQDFFIIQHGQRHTALGLGEQGNNGMAGMAPDYRDVIVLRKRAFDQLREEGVRPDMVQGCDPKEFSGVESAVFDEDLFEDGDGGVDGVRDDQDASGRAAEGNGMRQLGTDGRIDVEQIAPGHSWFSRYACRNDDEVGIPQGVFQRGVFGALVGGPHERLHLDVGVYVVQVCCDSGDVDHVVEGQLCDVWVQLEKQGQGLADAACGAQDGHFDGRRHYWMVCGGVDGGCMEAGV